MPSLGLITTGECEHRALGTSLQRVFERAELAPDLVFVVDDLELANIASADHVTQLVSDAFRRYLGTTRTHGELARLRERCSFHLLCPMLVWSSPRSSNRPTSATIPGADRTARGTPSGT
jgi:PAS domain-containing protein